MSFNTLWIECIVIFLLLYIVSHDIFMDGLTGIFYQEKR